MDVSEPPALVRLFIAIGVPADVRDALCEVQSRLKRTHAHVSWVKPENLHLSLAFLGNHPCKAVEELSALLDEISRNRAAFELTIQGVGAFGSERSPRILWAGADDSEPLACLHQDLTEGLKILGYDVETRPFAAHLTLGRVRSSRGRRELVEALNALRETPPVFGCFEATAVCLYRSILSQQGPTYRVLYSAPLGP